VDSDRPVDALLAKAMRVPLCLRDEEATRDRRTLLYCRVEPYSSQAPAVHDAGVQRSPRPSGMNGGRAPQTT
jgi:hypothetical protein